MDPWTSALKHVKSCVIIHDIHVSICSSLLDIDTHWSHNAGTSCGQCYQVSLLGQLSLLPLLSPCPDPGTAPGSNEVTNNSCYFKWAMSGNIEWFTHIRSIIDKVFYLLSTFKLISSPVDIDLKFVSFLLVKMK